ncbi:MAG: tyrosine-type recombinase/integrase, partial [Allobaculum sp.]|nr:tyrosine-type recombinase/integrase [Allobaculum sp.]
LVIKFIDYAISKYEINPWIIQEYAKITPSKIQQFLFEIEGGSSAKNTMHAALKKFFAFLEMNGYIPKDPMIKIKRPSSREMNEAVSLTPEEIEILFNNLKNPQLVKDGTTSKSLNFRRHFINRNLAMVSIALSNGLRSASLIGIDINDVNLDDKIIKVVQKGDRYHTVYLSENTIQYLKAWLPEREKILIEKGVESDALFLNSEGTRISYRQFDTVVKWASFGINKKISTHKLRSTCATNIYDATKDLNLTARVLGHQDVNTTMRYIHVEPEKERQAIGNLDKIFQ